MTQPSPIRGDTASLRAILLITAAIFVAQIACYFRSFGIKPASDDFPVVKEIVRGNQEGPGVFFRQSMTRMHHRPFKSLGIWAAGNLAPRHREFAIRTLHFAAMAGFAVVLALWISRLRLSALGTAVACAALMFHPALPQALGSIDGVDSIASSALIWLGAWFVLVWRQHIVRALLATAVCFVLAAGWKEYSFAIIPLVLWTIFCFGTRHRWRDLIGLVVGLGIVLAMILLIRQRAIPAGYGELRGADYVSRNPLQWVKNAATLATGLLFFGDSVWVFLHQMLAVLALVGFSVLLALGVIVMGVQKRIENLDDSSPDGSTRRWVMFLLGSFIAAGLPAIVIFHVSEMYLPPIMLPLALLCSLAAEGWSRARAAPRVAVTALATIALISSICAIYHKIEGLRDAGDHAEMQMQQILAMLPRGAHDMKIAVLFDERQLSPLRTYAVYRIGDDSLLAQPEAFEWFAPGRGLVLGSFTLNDPKYDPRQYDLVLKWNVENQKFQRVTPATPPSTQ